MTAFTPGPWEVVKHERFPFEREVKAEDGYICDMEGLSNDDMPTVDANANLTAAAPEMYEALLRIQILAESSELCGDRVPAVTAKTLLPLIKAALAKANGGQQ